MPSDLHSSALTYPHSTRFSCTVLDCPDVFFAQQTVAFGFGVRWHSRCPNQSNLIMLHSKRIRYEMYPSRPTFLRLRPRFRIAAVRQHYKSYEEIKNNLISSIRLNHLAQKYVWFLSCGGFADPTILVCQFSVCTRANLPSRSWTQHSDGNRHNAQSLYEDLLLLPLFSPKSTLPENRSRQYQSFCTWTPLRSIHRLYLDF